MARHTNVFHVLIRGKAFSMLHERRRDRCSYSLSYAQYLKVIRTRADDFAAVPLRATEPA